MAKVRRHGVNRLLFGGKETYFARLRTGAQSDVNLLPVAILGTLLICRGHDAVLMAGFAAQQHTYILYTVRGDRCSALVTEVVIVPITLGLKGWGIANTIVLYRQPTGNTVLSRATDLGTASIMEGAISTLTRSTATHRKPLCHTRHWGLRLVQSVTVHHDEAAFRPREFLRQLFRIEAQRMLDLNRTRLPIAGLAGVDDEWRFGGLPAHAAFVDADGQRFDRGLRRRVRRANRRPSAFTAYPCWASFARSFVADRRTRCQLLVSCRRLFHRMSQCRFLVETTMLSEFAQ